MNYIIPEIPSKAHNIYIMSLIDKQFSILQKYGISRGSSVSAAPNYTYPAYLWDLYDISQKVSSDTIIDNNINYFQLSQYSPFRLLYVKRFSDSSGENLYKNLNSFIPLAVNNTPDFSAHRYNCSLNFSPLINLTVNETVQDLLNTSNYENIKSLISDQFAGETIIYQAAINPLFPLFICSSIQEHYSFGPIFPTNIRFSVSGENTLGQVNVDCDFLGGKSLISPKIDLLNIRKPSLEPIVINDMDDIFGNAELENSYYYFNNGNLAYDPYDFYKYKSASLIDVIVIKDYINNYADLLAYRELLKTSNLPPFEKIIDISLNISQEVELIHTYPQIYYNNQYKYMGDKFGPKYATLKNRKVTGSITYFGYKQRDNFPNNSTGLTLYFGGPFYFAMKNVEWSAPSISVQPGNGYKYTYDFIARLPEFDNVNSYSENYVSPGYNVLNEDKTVSEFSYSNYSFNIQQFLNDFASLFKLF